MKEIIPDFSVEKSALSEAKGRQEKLDQSFSCLARYPKFCDCTKLCGEKSGITSQNRKNSYQIFSCDPFGANFAIAKFGIILVLTAIFCLCPLSHADALKERYVEFDYQVSLDRIPPETSQLNIWLPVMPENDYQVIEDIEIDPSRNSRLTFDKTYGNKILYYAFQSPQTPLDIRISYKVHRREYSNKSGENLKLQTSPKENPEDLEKFLKPGRLVTLSAQVKQLASGITKGKATTVEKARAIYDYVFNNVSYDKTIPGWGRGDTERVCLVKAGNCTDFHSLFISLARASGIPAKFVMGIPLSEKEAGEIPGYHCWAEFYDEQQGWIPVDISEAWKDKSKYEYFFGALSQNRLEFTQGRDIILEPSQKGEPLNYFIYPYIEADGKEFKDYSVKFQFREEVKKISKGL